MQRLVYENSWDKAVADQDRETIEKVFQETCIPGEQETSFSMIRTALNYKGELLVTGVLHNYKQDRFTVEKKQLTYKEEGRTIAESVFTIPQIVLEAETSMPWTFIFPVESIKNEPVLAGGQLDFIN
ncbi:SLAP domain-containing protein [Fictibacillus sp. KIGAM418]|uniref:SLAP domain-containing protein n=1 Tax=Fictibacillus marinisediminis TaxID=2878389 RepID=A0A9X1XEG2_9BACL|nr:SLAP domain-containing protein [Fictibacillus marinisediminis]MCK6259294.1 SLAP domain-containing protein [Fictibacillus marinisediminis]